MTDTFRFNAFLFLNGVVDETVNTFGIKKRRVNYSTNI